eukprot:scaffold490_cov323-Prasinococcus_capsulatus_cf.AAC.1
MAPAHKARAAAQGRSSQRHFATRAATRVPPTATHSRAGAHVGDRAPRPSIRCVRRAGTGTERPADSIVD